VFEPVARSMRPASWSSARWGEKRRKFSRAPGRVVLVTFAETKVTQGAGRSNPQLAFKVKSRQRRLLIIHYLDPGFRRGDGNLIRRSSAYSAPNAGLAPYGGG